MHHTVVLSDIHLCEVEPESGLWMRYRQRPWLPDRELAAMLDALCARVRGDRLSLVLNGDVFDFDAPRVIGQKSVFHDLPRTPENAVAAMAAILDDHPVFLAALGRVLAEGHELVFVSGNHDVQLTFPEVRGVLRARLVDAAFEAAAGKRAPPSRDAVARRIAFRAWFHLTHDGVLVEHGHQYDPYCSYRFPMVPLSADGRAIQPTMGSLATRLLVSRMGYFNPHVDSSFMLSAFGYMAHWARYYLWARRSLALTWATGTARILLRLVRVRFRGTRGQARANLLAAIRETRARAVHVARHARLFAVPAEDRLALVARELWLDRVVMAFTCFAIAAIAFFAIPHPLSYAALVSPLALVAYERLTPKDPLDATWRTVGRVARRVARIHRAKAVVFGHTHHAEGSWDGGVFVGNSGCWSAAYRDIACTQPAFDERPVIWLTSQGDGLGGGLVAWKDGAFQPRIVRPVPAPPPRASATDAARRPSMRMVRYAAARGASTSGSAAAPRTRRASPTPGSDATNAMVKNTGNPTRSAR